MNKQQWLYIYIIIYIYNIQVVMNVIVILLLLLLLCYCHCFCMLKSYSTLLWLFCMSLKKQMSHPEACWQRAARPMRTAWSPWMRISEWSAAKCGRIRSATARRGIFQATDWDRNGSTTGISRIGVMLVNGKCDFFIKTGKWDWLFLQSDIGISSAEMGIQPKKKGKWLEGALLSQAYHSFI